MSKTTDQIKKQLAQPKKKEPTPISLSTGSTLLNLACTGDAYNGFLAGHYYYLVGDSASGKTFLALTCLAEASMDKRFDNYRFIFDNAEDGALMDIKKFFGSKVVERLESPSISEEGSPQFSRTIEELYFHLDDAIDQGIPFIYIIDSMDSLSSEYEGDKFQEHKKAFRRGKEAPGSYGDGKAKINSSGIRQILSKMRSTGSILIIISQTRDSLGFGFETKTRSGGRALKFYATLEIWSACGPKIKKTALGKARTIGVNCELTVKKNRVNGRERKVSTPIFYEIGIDDIGSCINFLVDEGKWQKRGGKGGSNIDAPEFKFVGSERALIKKIETEGLEQDLRDIVQDAWNEIEEACNLGRKPRYD